MVPSPTSRELEIGCKSTTKVEFSDLRPDRESVVSLSEVDMLLFRLRLAKQKIQSLERELQCEKELVFVKNAEIEGLQTQLREQGNVLIVALEVSETSQAASSQLHGLVPFHINIRLGNEEIDEPSDESKYFIPEMEEHDGMDQEMLEAETGETLDRPYQEMLEESDGDGGEQEATADHITDTLNSYCANIEEHRRYIIEAKAMQEAGL
ncbi:hypothetical protein M501DRAFT_1027890 [Patellaria atrata CBS 101060]|uniref:Uncharacterized protein n=1 Tax=Patellaria atrata CBS 101060 TaxID=1346257 RepID=A0A9P4SI04_9PEZI|nr:hypothetical protein M501DRAFT_1027890 [Patellaria atrata CBS 101060]